MHKQLLSLGETKNGSDSENGFLLLGKYLTIAKASGSIFSD